MISYEPTKPVTDMSWDELVEHNKRRLEQERAMVESIRATVRSIKGRA